MPLHVDIQGLAQTKRKLEQVADDLHGSDMRSGMQQATLIVTRDAKRFAPVDTGALRADITPSVFSSRRGVTGTVGSTKFYAPFMELGTGTFVGRPPHRPPASALRQWARRHRMSAYVVARAIARRGGLEPRRFLQRALEQNEDQIANILGRTVERIVSK
jgi:HK97 gp10 family phage protein